MDTLENLDHQIVGYLDMLKERQKEALLAVAKAFAEEPEYDDDLITELDRRTRSLEEGEIQGISWSDVKKKAHVKSKIK